MSHKEFLDKARAHQIEYMKRWGDGIDCYTTSDPEYKSDNPDKRVWLTMPNARKGLLFYEGFREEILTLPDIKKRLDNKQDYLLSIALRSEHIPYNLFYPLIKDKDNPVVPGIFALLINSDVARVCDIRIEYAPAPKSKYLFDGTSFDVYVEYLDTEGQRCGIGIEVKYTEREYTVDPSVKEWQETHDVYGRPLLSIPYKKATENSGYYKEGVVSLLVTDYLRQIWRNHILGASMVANGDIAKFHSLTLYPEANQHFHDAERVYRAVLTDKGNRTFGAITYEWYFHLLRQAFRTQAGQDWIAYLQERYLF